MASSDDRKQKRRAAWQAITRYLRRYRRGLIAGGVCLLVADLLALVTPWIMKVTIDGLKEGIGCMLGAIGFKLSR